MKTEEIEKGAVSLIEERALKRGRLMYIFEVALEYLISVLVAGSFLATITKELGLSDRLTGILSSIAKSMTLMM